jgi:hypothetical protein
MESLSGVRGAGFRRDGEVDDNVGENEVVNNTLISSPSEQQGDGETDVLCCQAYSALHTSLESVR